MISDVLKELLVVFAISAAVAVGSVLLTVGYPGMWLTEFYLTLFNRKIPSELGLGGLFIALVMSFLYPFGIFWGYLVGFRLVPWLLRLPDAAKWGVGIGAFVLWTLGVFELCYRWALWQAKKL
ncbi:MAG: hypothetical protein RMI34_09505 [Chloroherpetonaceae bacterium]|nr:hypothetical protein [Chloroherpetonaceae bacterium]MCS7210470.1 hypothetical protein [Chloroherpetonaceae bacterium]MDW8020293.1 hypothetical protein [Chloroherpetonaceae bacterium]MDW8466514.1 hypothetical protein [Chloroherpetonaceae bacterium]